MPTRKKAESQRAAEGKNTAAQGPPPQKQSQLLRELLVTKVGLFGSPEKKLRSDIAKKLNIPKKDSFSENSLIAYSQLKGVKEKLEKVRAEVAKRGARGAGIIIKGSKEKDALIAKEAEKKADAEEDAAKRKADAEEDAAKRTARADWEEAKKRAMIDREAAKKRAIAEEEIKKKAKAAEEDARKKADADEAAKKKAEAETERKELERIKYESLTVVLDPEVMKLSTGKLLSLLEDTKRWWFGNPQKRLIKDIMGRLGTTPNAAPNRENLLAYAQFRDVNKKLASLMEKEKMRRAKEDREKRSKLKKGNERVKKKVGAVKKFIANNLTTDDLLSMLVQTKGGLFGNPEIKLRKDLTKRLNINSEDAFTRGALLAYTQFKDVNERLMKIEARRWSDARKAEENSLLRQKEELEGLIKRTKLQFFKHQISNEIANKQITEYENKLAIVVEQLNQNKKARASWQKKEADAAAMPDTAKTPLEAEEAQLAAAAKPAKGIMGAEGQAMQRGSTPLFLLVSGEEKRRLLEELKELRKGRFGNPEKKLAKDISRRLQVDEKDALKEENIDTYAKLDDVKKRIEKLEAAKQTKAEKEAEKAVGKKGGSLIIKANAAALTATPPITREISQKADMVAELLEEQKRIVEEDARRKAKKKLNQINPFAIVSRIINNALGRLFKIVFVAFVLVVSVPINLGKLIAKGVGGVMGGLSKRTGKVSPFGWKKRVTQLVIYSGMSKTQEEVTGMTIIGGAALGAIVAITGFLFFGFDHIIMIVSAVVSFIAVWIVVYAVLNLMADKRTDEVEGTLPDVLQIVSANISAGMTPYNALWVAARKEFGALAEEIKIAQKQTLGGKPFADALMEMGTRVKSNIFQRTIRLLIQGMKAGGELPQILNGIGTDIRQMRLLQKEMAANTMSYILFILFGMILGAPLLFSVSIQFVDIMNRFQPEGINTEAMTAAQMSSPASGMQQGFNVMSLGGGGCPKDFDGDGIPDAWEKKNGLNPKNGSDGGTINPNTGKTYIYEYQKTAEPLPGSCITPGYLSTFAMLALASIAIFGSILIGLIKEGKQSAGLKLMPMLLLATLGMFILMNKGLSMFFGAMFGG